MQRPKGGQTAQERRESALPELATCPADLQPGETLDQTETGKHGFRPFPSRGGVVTNAMIDELRDGLE